MRALALVAVACRFDHGVTSADGSSRDDSTKDTQVVGDARMDTSVPDTIGIGPWGGVPG